MAPTDTKRKLEDAGLEKTEEGLSKRPKAAEITKGQKECATSDCKLEKYLEDIFLKYCRISINEKEVDFIRNGVETLTLEYLQKTYRNSPCKDKSCKISKCGQLELVRAGSFYEGTRNGFPDEFDFIAVLGTVDEQPDENAYTHIKQEFCANCEVYKSNEYPDYSMKFRYTNVSRCHRKVTRLEYVYTRGQEEMIIDVDIVIALRCYKTEQFYTVIFNKEFYEEMIKTGSFLFIYTGASTVEPYGPMVLHAAQSGTWEKTTTETEKRFVKDILSKKHRKVYRILKYIINGPFGGDLFRYLDDVQDFRSPLSGLFGTGFSISSYVIKIAVIRHHYACQKDRKGIGNCVCEILFNIIAAFPPFKQNNFPIIAMRSLLCSSENGLCIGRGNNYFLENIYKCLEAFTKRLKSLQSSNDGLEKCNHDLENSFSEMALRLYMFTEYETFFMNSDSEFPNLKIVWLSKPNVNEQAMVKKVKEYKEKRNKVQDCPWCDYPIPTRKL
ncbi:uncharacterized protein LOC132731233 isoform X2 [Ruditapes philippinarum]|uniref:uncharacterized protein LOC132731233 isoform X2 n=1 Tax=Ruditapes philippinarum TaxID=129788 RepID=UPI00295AE59A|nr:uncharacterized protein LOC132731233 isoform X2 [Ruditapes philippinarum]